MTMTAERLADLAKTTEKCTWADIIALDPQITSRIGWEPKAEDIPVLDKYLDRFIKPKEIDSCIDCGKRPRDTFVWGLTHGQGHCYACGYPAILYHFTEDMGFHFRNRIVMLLQYHPGELTVTKSDG